MNLLNDFLSNYYFQGWEDQKRKEENMYLCYIKLSLFSQTLMFFLFSCELLGDITWRLFLQYK